ncbi:uncharacterized protein LOC133803180 isoform X3 [Humulus lupulus]|uniref:uncharacterized protein LOC133803180 isoform X3 n=1 Tax=Humulus lupulus TaxID=3486 RepID=UPI002B4042B3|nr:uncharacterized protein LOC133803180 isoform X3 [Humulus lupulus]
MRIVVLGVQKQMDKDSTRHNHTTSTTTNNNSNNNPSTRERCGGGDGSLLLRASSDALRQTTTSDYVLQWGNRKRLRCMKVQVKDDSTGPVNRTTVRVDRRVVRADKDSSNQPSITHNSGYLNLRQRPSSPQPPPSQRILRNSESASAMRGQSNGGVRGITSPDRGAHDKKGAATNHNHHHHHHHNENNHNNKSAASSETAHDSKKGGGSSSGSGELAAVAPPVWPPKFVIALTNKEKEEDFFAFKGSKLPQRPKKRSKFIQRTLNLVSPGAWLCDLTLERYEVREKKIIKKRPRGLKAMGNMESESE